MIDQQLLYPLEEKKSVNLKVMKVVGLERRRALRAEIVMMSWTFKIEL